MLTPDLVDFLEGGLSLLVGTRDARMAPECARAMGVRAHPDLRHVTVYVPEATAGRIVEDLADNGLVAVTFSRPSDHRTFQLKGRAGEVRAARDDERLQIELYRAAFAVQLELAGVPRRRTLQLAHWPAWAIEVRIEDVFVQTPGPDAGRRLSA